MSQFGNSPKAAVAAYVNHVRAGVNLPSVWQQLQGQMYLGNAKFVEVIGEKIGTRLSADAEIPRLQRRASAPPLARFAAMPARNPAIGRVVFLVWTPRGDDTAHLTSCRYADRKETDAYFITL